MSAIHLPFGALVSFADPPSVEPQVLMPSPFQLLPPSSSPCAGANGKLRETISMHHLFTEVAALGAQVGEKVGKPLACKPAAFLGKGTGVTSCLDLHELSQL